MAKATQTDRSRPGNRARNPYPDPNGTILRQINELRTMTTAELRLRYVELFGTESRSSNKQHLFKKLAWRIQELEYGGLSDRAKKRALEIANDLDARVRVPRDFKVTDGAGQETYPIDVATDPSFIPPGTILSREYNGEVHTTTALEKGFEYRGRRYNSLSGVAKAITGTQWSGRAFFGLPAAKRKSKGRS